MRRPQALAWYRISVDLRPAALLTLCQWEGPDLCQDLATGPDESEYY